MKEELRKILEQYEAIQKKHENKLTSCRQMIKAKDAELRTLCADLKTYRENEEAAKAISEEIKKLKLCLFNGCSLFIFICVFECMFSGSSPFNLHKICR